MRTARVMAAMLLVGMLLTTTAREVDSASAGDSLAGTTWHTVRIDGDALFFFIRDVGIRFEQGGRFTAAVRFIDGQQGSRTGSYQIVKPGTALLSIDGLGKPKPIQFRRQGKDLIIQDRAYDVKVRLAPGKMEEEHWF